MTGIVDWASRRARMVIALILLSVGAGAIAYVALPKEGEPDISIPGLFVSVPFQGISAEDSEKLLVKPMEAELQDLDGLKKMTANASEGYAGVFLEFDFDWDKTKTIADVRDRMNRAEAEFPEGADKYTINEINFSEFPILVVALSGEVPERTLLRLANALQDRLEAMPAILDAGIAGERDEMLEVTIDPLALEAYNVTAAELINVVVNNNRLVAAGELEGERGAFSVKIPASFNDVEDVYQLPIKVNGDRVVTLGELADIRLTFADRKGTARYNGRTTIALQVVKRKGFNIIETSREVRKLIEEERQTWPEALQKAVRVDVTLDQSRTVKSMISQLEGSVLTAIALVMIVVLGSLGLRSALLVGFAIPTSFLLCFALLAIMGVAISNIVMFGLILAVGMLVDGAIVVVEYADKRISEGSGPMSAYVEAAKRMFWPVVSSTATTLCAFLPMLFWPGVPGEFMGMLPVTLIFVLSASLVVALVYLPVVGGVAGRLSRLLGGMSAWLRDALPWPFRLVLAIAAAWALYLSARQVLNPAFLLDIDPDTNPALAVLPGAIMFVLSVQLVGVVVGSLKPIRRPRRIHAGRRRRLFGALIRLVAGNPVMPVVTLVATVAFVVTVFVSYGRNNLGVEFFVKSEPENAIVYVRARGNLSVAEKDALVREAEAQVLDMPGIASVFAFAGSGGLNQNTGGATAPRDTIGQIQIELEPWEARKDDPDLDGDLIMARVAERVGSIPGIRTDILEQSRGPASGKPLQLRLEGDHWNDLVKAVEIVEARFAQTPGLVEIEDTRPLPGIDWRIDVDVEKAGRYGVDVATVGGLVQLVTRGLVLDTMRADDSDKEIDIPVRLPPEYRTLSTLETLRVPTRKGLVPLSNFIQISPDRKLGRIDRINQKRFFDVKADVSDGLVKLVGDGPERVMPATAVDADPELSQAVAEGRLTVKPVNANERIAEITRWLESEHPLPDGISWEWSGDQEEQAESQAFLGKAFLGALGLMFVILLAQFNSFYNAVLVLLAVVLSTTGVLIGMMVMHQPFSIIMTGTGIVALAGIVVNNNIVLIDTYQEYASYMPRIEAIVRTAEDRLRPVLLTTITTMAGLAPMMFGLSLDFFAGGYTIDAPTALWWKQLATAVVFGLGVATMLTLVLTPALLAIRVWLAAGAYATFRQLAALSFRRDSARSRDLALRRATRRLRNPLIVWEADGTGAAPADAGAAGPAGEGAQGDEVPPETSPETPPETPPAKPPLRAAE